MAEKPDRPKQLTLDLEGKKSSSSSVKVVLGGEAAPKEKKTPSRVKPTVTTRSMTVKIPGPKPAATQEAKKPASKGTKPPVRKTPQPRGSEIPNPHLVQTHQPKSNPDVPKRTKVVPPPIGKRKGYRTPLAKLMLVPLLGAVLLFCIAILIWVFLGQAKRPGVVLAEAQQSQAVALTIERGMSARSVSQLLEHAGVVEDGQALLDYFIEADLATRLKTGAYLMEKGLPFKEIGALLTSTSEDVVLTISPAFTLKSIDQYLSSRLSTPAGSFLQATENLASAYQLGFCEGWLLSGSYTVSRSRSAELLALSMYEAMLEEVRLHLSSPLVEEYSIEELLIIASMIQAETQEVAEMRLISSVIHNRLAKGEPLGIDATTRYELGDWVNPIPPSALEAKTPYNTRRKVGLPPTGICSPSKEAVYAAFFPQQSDYFYYLHGLDKQIHFAKTYEEHKENIKAFRQAP
ncbi:endolytic transglycosylase MltG [Sphaerochaeta sp.]|uniref:endolytic transglycosylase MltG n=1 Tax=Sphaerochaeta sp. TaxID=1972642 RepID=UPI003D12800B